MVLMKIFNTISSLTLLLRYKGFFMKIYEHYKLTIQPVLDVFFLMDHLSCFQKKVSKCFQT